MSLSVTSSLFGGSPGGVSGSPSALAVLQALSPRTPDEGSPATPSPSSSVASTASAGPQGLFALADGVGQALTVADAADAAGQQVLGLLHQMHALAGQAADPSTSADQRAALDQQFQASAGQVAPILSTATVNGANLVDGSLTSGLKVALGDGTTASLTPVDLSLGGSTVALPSDASLATVQGAASTLASLDGAIGGASAGLSTLQAQADRIGAHAGFVQTLGQALASPHLASPDRDGGDSVRLLALQVSQQLSAQPSAIANQSPQSILSLFRS